MDGIIVTSYDNFEAAMDPHVNQSQNKMIFSLVQERELYYDTNVVNWFMKIAGLVGGKKKREKETSTAVIYHA